MTDGDARLVAAVRAGDLPEVHALLGPGSNPDAVDGDGLPVLCAAVAAGEEEIAGALLGAGADPGAVDADGVPVLCAAVAAFAHKTVEALVEAGADPDRVLPDGTTPLLRAVEGGSPAVVSALLDERPARLPEAARDRLLVAARWWYERGAEGELRRLTGATGPADVRWVRDGGDDRVDDRVEEVTLGGRTVRAGHGAVLTRLEWHCRILAPVGELVARAVRHGDPEHADWWASLSVLGQRQSAWTWQEVVALHRDPAPLRREFVADYLSLGWMMSAVTGHARWYERKQAELLGGWADTERDGRVLARLLGLLEADDHPAAREFGLRHTGHPDPRVRRRVPRLFGRPLDPEALRAVLDLGRDPDAGVRKTAAEALGGEELSEEDRPVLLALLRDGDPEVRSWAAFATARSADRSPRTTEALWELLGSEEQELRLSAAYGLALRDDPGTVEAYAGVGPLGPELAADHRAEGLWRWRFRNEPRE
ncbi:HEAT repeat domain-containing protein [Streptomyces sp. NPDC051582]|uniref:HEAT repeat domain-containing protein n=1 Tax=Streptomyces sp. NPDC051582 TaxID=3155167 RepID=UPI0034392517